MSRSSSSSGSTPSRMAPPSRATPAARRARGLEIVAEIGEVVEPGGEAADERRPQSVDQQATRGIAASDCGATPDPAAPRSERGARHQAPMSCTVRRVSCTLPARWCGRRTLRRHPPILNPLHDSSGFNSQVRSSRLPSTSPPVKLVEQRPGPCTIRRFDDVEVPEGGRIDQQVVGADPERHLADVRQAAFWVSRR